MPIVDVRFAPEAVVRQRRECPWLCESEDPSPT